MEILNRFYDVFPMSNVVKRLFSQTNLLCFLTVYPNKIRLRTAENAYPIYMWVKEEFK